MAGLDLVNPITHFLAGWGVAHVSSLEKRDRWLVAVAGIAPDVDGLGAVVDVYTRVAGGPVTHLFETYHHLFHNLAGALTTTLLFAFLARRRAAAATLVFASFHLHLLCDLLGSRGPDGYQWPIPYLLPFSSHPQLSWSGQWGLASWQNAVVTLGLLLLMFALARRRGYSPLEAVSTRADAAFVATIRKRFPLESPKDLCHDGALDDPEKEIP